MQTKLRYVTSVVANISGSAAGTRIFAANGLYDPDITGTGHQPMGFDQFAGIYERYLVLHSKLVIKNLAPGAAANAAPVAIGVLLSKDASIAYPSVDALMEQGQSKYILGSCNHWIYSDAGTIRSKKYDPRSFFAVVDPQDIQDEIGAVVTSNPSSLAYFNIWYGQTPSGVDAASLTITVEIEYTCLFDKIREVAQS